MNTNNEVVGSVVLAENTPDQPTMTQPKTDLLGLIKEAEKVLYEAQNLSREVYITLTNEEKIEFLKDKVNQLKRELVYWSCYFEKKKKREGLGRMLLESDILQARKSCDSEMGCAKILGVSYTTYLKYCNLYGLYQRGGRPNSKNHGLVHLDAPVSGSLGQNLITLQ